MSMFMLSRTSGKRGFALEHAGEEAGTGKGAALQEASAIHAGEEPFNRDDQNADCEQRGELGPTERKQNGKLL